jgi:hypothetical protein
VQHLSALSLLDFPFLGAAFASSKCSGRRRRGRGKSDLSLVSPSAPSVALRVRIHRALRSAARSAQIGSIPVEASLVFRRPIGVRSKRGPGILAPPKKGKRPGPGISPTRRLS